MNCKDCAACCGPVALTHRELEAIKGAWMSLGKKRREQLKAQKRERITCILLDTKTKQCSIYSARPLSCEMFGHYQGLKCEFNPNEPLASDKEGKRRIQENGMPIGTLSITIGYKQLEV